VFLQLLLLLLLQKLLLLRRSLAPMMGFSDEEEDEEVDVPVDGVTLVMKAESFEAPDAGAVGFVHGDVFCMNDDSLDTRGVAG